MGTKKGGLKMEWLRTRIVALSIWYLQLQTEAGRANLVEWAVRYLRAKGIRVIYPVPKKRVSKEAKIIAHALIEGMKQGREPGNAEGGQ